MVTLHHERQSYSRFVGLVITLLIVVGCLSEASVVNASVILSNTSDAYTGNYTDLRGTDQPTDNYGEHTGIRVISTWDVESVKSVGMAMCQTLTPPSVNRDVWLNVLDSSEVVIATSSVVNMADLPYCTSYSTTSLPMQLTYFTFPDSFTLDNDEAIIPVTEIMSSATGIRVLNSNVNPSTIIEDYWCYSQSNSSYTCLSYFSLPYFELNNAVVGNDSSNYDGTSYFSSQNSRFVNVKVNSFVVGQLTITGGYYLDPAEVNRNVSELNPTYVKYRNNNRATTTFTTTNNPISATSTGYATSTNTYTGLSAGTYDAVVGFSNVGCNLGLSGCPFADSYVYITYQVNASGTLIANTTTFEYYDNTTPAGSAEANQPCGLSNFSGCISNALAYLFVPSDSTIDGYTQLNNELATKFPFAYAYDFSSTINTLYTTTASQSGTLTVPFGTFGNITLISSAQLSAVPFASFIKSLLGYALWIMFMIAMYRRTLTIFNPSPV